MEENTPLYLFSGLGADERMFQNLVFRHHNPKFVQWIPALKGETLTNYAKRLLPQMEPGSLPPILVGVSFGGIVAQEIAKLIPVRKIIVLSSLVNHKDLAWYHRLGGFLQLHQWLPFQLLRRWEAPANWIFGAKTPEEKKLLKQVIMDTDINYLRWALQKVLSWKQNAPSPITTMIHGDADKVLPVPCSPKVHVIKGGEHLMLLSRAEEVSALINCEIQIS